MRRLHTNVMSFVSYIMLFKMIESIETNLIKEVIDN